LLTCLGPILKELSYGISTLQKGSISSQLLCHITVTFCINEGLIELLLNFAIRLQSWAITSKDSTPSVKVRLQTWKDAMDVLFRLLIWASRMQDEYPQPCRELIKCCLASQGDSPGELVGGITDSAGSEGFTQAGFVGIIAVTHPL
jgi:hypothetical protein